MYHTLSVEEVLAKTQSSATEGISYDEAKKRLAESGSNVIPHEKKDTALKKFLREFSSILVLVLIAAALVSLVIGETLDAIVILVIVFLNATMGYVQEARAEKAIEALKKLATSRCKVIRNGSIMEVNSEDLVVGDVIILEMGEKIPADARIIEAVNLELSEAILTGESRPIKKGTEIIYDPNAALGDRLNIVFKDTIVTYGRGKAVIFATGKDTEMGKISQMLSEEKKVTTPLEKELDVVGKKLSLAAGIIIAAIFGIGVFTNGTALHESFLTAISLAVAAIPEGLPAIVTITLAIGVSKLAKQKAIIRRLQAVETLGSTNYIITDKTGTLTKNEMAVTNIATFNSKYTVSENTFVDSGGHITEPTENYDLSWLLHVAVICNDASISKDGHKFIGDSTETALLEAAEKAHLDIEKIRNDYPRVFEIPFTSKNKKMIVCVENPIDKEKILVCAKGAPEIIETLILHNGETIASSVNEYAQQGLRDLAFSYKEITKEELNKAKKLADPEEIISNGHTFLGIIAQKDPLRPEVKDALQKATAAGIKTIILTGDHKLTATNIAAELGLIKITNEVMDGNELGDAAGEKLDEILKTVKVFARVSPEQKLRIVEKVREWNKIVAVTGDGVNDAPAIKAADIGISMGISGTDVSKEVSDMILEDDNYATIVEAIKQGRIIYDNLVKFIKYLVSCNMSEILVVGIIIFLRKEIPLLPIHLLWVNLITDGLPALSLGVEPGEKDIMLRNPRDHKRGLLTEGRWFQMGYEAILITTAAITAFFLGRQISLEVAQSTALLALAFAQLFHAFNNRSEEHSIFSKELSFNSSLALTFVASASIQLLSIFTPIGNIYLNTVAPSLELAGIAILLSLTPIVGSEILKAAKLMRRKEKLAA